MMSAVINGDEHAVAVLYQRHGAAIHGFASRLCGRDRADEVVQEVFVRLWQSPQPFDAGRGSVRAFLLANTHSRAVDVVRSDIARSNREVADWLRQTPSGVTVDDAVFSRVLEAGVKSVVNALPRPQRDAIVLAYFAGHTYREVAALLGEPEATIKSRIRRGLARLRAGLEEVQVTAS